MMSSSQEGKYVWLGFRGWTWQRPPHPFHPPPTEFQAPDPWAARGPLPPSLPLTKWLLGPPWIQLWSWGPPGV